MKNSIAAYPLALILMGFGPDVASPRVVVQDTKPAKKASAPAKPTPTLAEVRRGFQTKLAPKAMAAEPLPEPPGKVFRLVRYDAPAGKLAAYLTPNPNNGKKNPAIIWITGGDCNSIGDLWSEKPRKNDQTAAAYRKAGIVLMFPSLRGGNDNPGRRESYFGEVDDVLAAADYLAKQDYVDPSRIYLGGHSTGGTMVMLVAECSKRFRGVFSFGPADDVRGYGQDDLHFDATDLDEVAVRSPGYWLGSVGSPLFVFEGTAEPNNIDSLQKMASASKNPQVHFLAVKDVNHFSILAPVNDILAAKIVADRGPKTNITVSAADLASVR